MSDSTRQGDLPAGWVWTTLGDIRLDPSAAIDPSRFPNEFFELYSVPSYPNQQPELVTGREIGSNKKSVRPNTVLLCKINPRINRVWVVGDYSPHRKIASTEWIPFYEVEGLQPKYLAYFMQNDEFRAYLATNVSGVGGSLMRVSPSTIQNYPFPLAPLPEQQRIVAAIETHFTRLDAAVAALQRVQANLRRYRAAVLKAACEGRLVPTEAALARQVGRTYEPADVLLARILAERRARWEAEHPGKRYVEPAGPRQAALPALPEGWVWAAFDQILLELRNGYFGGRPASEPPGKPILRVSSVRPMCVSYDDLRYLPGVADHELTDYELAPGDLLFTRYNGSRRLVGACGLVRQFSEQILYPDKLIRARITGGFDLPAYLEIYFNTEAARTIVEQTAKTTAGQYGISGGELRAIRVPLPPLAEQERIVAEVERRLSVVAEVEAAVAANVARAARLRQAVLKQAFAGRLVPY